MAARIAPLDPPYVPELQTHFDAVMKGRPPLLLFRTLARSERAWAKFRAASLLDGRLLTLRQREIVIDRVCAQAGCEYEWGVHVTAFAQAAGLTEAQVRATVHGAADDPAWTPEEGSLVAAVDALHAGCALAEPIYAALAVWASPEQVLDVIMLAGFYRTVAYIANSLELTLEPGAARFPAA